MTQYNSSEFLLDNSLFHQIQNTVKLTFSVVSYHNYYSFISSSLHPGCLFLLANPFSSFIWGSDIEQFHWLFVESSFDPLLLRQNMVVPLTLGDAVSSLSCLGHRVVPLLQVQLPSVTQWKSYCSTVIWEMQFPHSVWKYVSPAVTQR